jgi:hypothetical protein
LFGLPDEENVVDARLTDEGGREAEGEGGKMITSLEIMTYGGMGRYILPAEIRKGHG